MLDVPVVREEMACLLTPLLPCQCSGGLRGWPVQERTGWLAGLTTYRVVRRQLEEVGGEDGRSKEPQEDEAAHGCVPHVQVIWGSDTSQWGATAWALGFLLSCPSWGLCLAPSAICLSVSVSLAVTMVTIWSHRCAPHSPAFLGSHWVVYSHLGWEDSFVDYILLPICSRELPLLIL